MAGNGNKAKNTTELYNKLLQYSIMRVHNFSGEGAKKKS